MKHKVSELEGALLDAAVAKAEGVLAAIMGEVCVSLYPSSGRSKGPYCPSSYWDQGGPLIDRERIDISEHGHWTAQLRHLTNDAYTGPTPLVAAMRAYVASKFGEEVELP